MVNKNGFSLIEVTIATSVAAVAGVLLVALLVQNSGLYQNQSAKVSQGLSLNDTVTQIGEVIKPASSVAAACPNPPCTTPYNSDSSTLVLALPSIDSQSQVITNTYDYVVITKDSQKSNILRKIVYTDSLSSRKSQNTVLATTLSKTTFLYYNQAGQIVSPTSSTKVNFSINLTQNNVFSNQSSSSSGEVNLKNY